MVMEHGKKLPRTRLTVQQESFAVLLVNGALPASAYRDAYKSKASHKTLTERASRLAKLPRVAARIQSLRDQTAGQALLTVNDRLKLLAEAARAPVKTSSDRSARARVIEVYTKIGGGAVPEKVEISAPGGGPIKVEATVTHTHQPVRARIAALKAAREARG